MAGVLVFVELAGSEPRGVALETLGAAAHVAGTLGEVTALVIGHECHAVAERIGQYGPSRVLVVDDPAFAAPVAGPYARALEAAVAATEPALVLLPATTLGRDIAPIVATRLGAPHLVECMSLTVEDQTITATRPVYQGKLLTMVTAPRDTVVFATVRAGAFKAPTPDEAKQATIERMTVTLDAADQRAAVTGLAPKGRGGTALESAPIVVVGGRGIGGPQGFALLEELAAALGGAVGCTRAVSDLGWRPHDEQIGQTGKQVSPKLYLGVGVSGAVQHTVGMRGAEVVVAINRDPNAPLVQMADFAIVADYNEIVPRLTKRLQELREAAGKA